VKVKISKEAKKDIKNLDSKIRSKVKKVVNKLRNKNINISKLSGKGNQWKIRIGNYRMIIEICKEEDLIRVRRVKLRKDVYRNI